MFINELYTLPLAKPHGFKKKASQKRTPVFKSRCKWEGMLGLRDVSWEATTEKSRSMQIKHKLNI